MREEHRKKLIRWSILLLWMIFIFFMSSQDGNKSTGQSNFVAELFKYFGFDIKGILGDTGTFIIRKTAHFSEYFILCILFYRVIIMYVSVSTARIISIICTFIYASSDELHQFFVPGRTCAFKDVIIDTIGGATSILILYIFSKIKNKFLSKLERKQH